MNIKVMKYPALTKEMQGVIVEQARSKVVYLINKQGFEKTVKYLNQKGLSLCLIYPKKEIQPVLIPDVKKSMYILDNEIFGINNLFEKINIGFGNEKLLLNLILKTIPKKYTGVNRTESLSSAGELIYLKVNEYIDYINNKNKEQLNDLKNNKKIELIKKEKAVEKEIDNYLINFSNYKLKKDIKNFHGGDDLFFESIRAKYSIDNGKFNLSFIVLKSDIESIKFKYLLNYKQDSNLMREYIPNEYQEKMIINIFNNIFKKDIKFQNEFINNYINFKNLDNDIKLSKESLKNNLNNLPKLLVGRI